GSIRRAGRERERHRGDGLRRRLAGMERRDRMGQVRGDGRGRADSFSGVVVLKFRAGELEFNATIAEASESPSPQTGDPLRALTIQFRAQKEPMHELALVEAEQRRAGGLFSLAESGEPELEWRVQIGRAHV